MFHIVKHGRAMSVASAGGTARAVERALDVLLAFADQGGDLGITELSRHLGLPKPTVYRFVEALARRDLLARDSQRRRYRLGLSALRLGSAYLRDLDVRRVALPVMQELARATGETVDLNIVRGYHRVCIEKVESDQAIRHFVELGRPLPLYAGASGKVLLAWMEPADMEAVIAAGLPPLTPRTVTDPGRLRADLAEIRRRGYAISVGERVAGASAVSAPVRDASRRVVAGLTISGPTYRLTPTRLRRFSGLVRRGAAKISAGLGYTSPRAAPSASGGTTTQSGKPDMAAADEPASLVARFLELSAQRRLNEASAFLDPRVEIVFPGNIRCSSLRQMADAMRQRYRWVRKRIRRWDVLPGTAGTAIVYCLGTLHGEDPAGRRFKGVRFIDRFEVRDGRIVRHEVWNDLAEHGRKVHRKES